MGTHDALPVTITNVQLNRLPSQDKGARRVAFTEILPKHRSSDDSDPDDLDHKKCRPHDFVACCAWTCLVIFGIILSLLIIGVIFMSFLQSGLPEISVIELQLSKFDITNTTSTKGVRGRAVLNAKTEISIEMMNKNDKVELSYNQIEVNIVTEEEVKLGKAMVKGFIHKPGNTTYLNLMTTVVGDDVDREDAMDLKDDDKNVQMVVLVTMKTSIGFHIGMFRMRNVPIMVSCNVQQFVIANQVNQPLCNIRMFPTR